MRNGGREQSSWGCVVGTDEEHEAWKGPWSQDLLILLLYDAVKKNNVSFTARESIVAKDAVSRQSLSRSTCLVA